MDAGFTAVMHITELGRRVLADQLAIIQMYQSDLSQNSSITAVHETRKAIRRTFTAVKLFHPFFEPGLLHRYRQPLKLLMKQLGPCRDTAVFLDTLHGHTTDSPFPLDALERYWRGQLAAADANLRLYLAQPQWPPFWAEYATFTATPHAGRPLAEPNGRLSARRVIPVLLYQRVAAVLAYDVYVTSGEQLAVEKLHKLRIQCKELRYTLQFFAPLLGPEIESVLMTLKLLQVNLGDMNDARVALAMLADTPGLATAVTHYSTIQNGIMNRLLDAFHPLWAELTAPAWQQSLDMTLIGLMKGED